MNAIVHSDNCLVLTSKYTFQIRREGDTGFRDQLWAAGTSLGLILDPAQTHHLQLYHHLHRRYRVMLIAYIMVNVNELTKDAMANVHVINVEICWL